MTDPIADMLTRIRNAVQARHPRVEVPASRLKLEIARILQREGYIQSVKLVEPKGPSSPMGQKVLRLVLKYGPNGERVLSGLERVSKPGRRIYCRHDAIPAVLGGLGVSILTTPRGVMTGREAAQAGVGGEVLCYVW
jgi:small subunit ribosomal protein S8